MESSENFGSVTKTITLYVILENWTGLYPIHNCTLETFLKVRKLEKLGKLRFLEKVHLCSIDKLNWMKS